MDNEDEDEDDDDDELRDDVFEILAFRSFVVEGGFLLVGVTLLLEGGLLRSSLDDGLLRIREFSSDEALFILFFRMSPFSSHSRCC